MGLVCRGCGVALRPEDADLGGGPYRPVIVADAEVTNGGEPAVLVGPRHLVSADSSGRAVSGWWCGPVEEDHET